MPTAASGDGREPRWLWRWLVALNGALLVAALVLGAWMSRRAFFLALLVPVAIVPFSYARWRLHRAVARTLADAPLARRAFAAAGMLCDAVLVAQLLTGRSAEAVPLLQSPGVTWVGPVWFSAHALLFLAYSAVGALRGLRRLGIRAGRRLGRSERPPREAGLASPSRREFLQRASLVVPECPSTSRSRTCRSPTTSASRSARSRCRTGHALSTGSASSISPTSTSAAA